jgi:hypothetical protein
VAEGGLGASGTAAIVVATIALVVFALQITALVRALFRNPDIASMPHLVTLLAGTPGDRTVTLANAPEYESLSILRATLDWPGHRLVWQALPFVLAGVGLLVLARTVRRTWGPWCAAMAVTTLAVTAEGLRMTLFGINAHAFTLLSVIVLGAVVVGFARRPPRSAARWVLSGVALVAVVAPGVPDLLLMLTGIVPFTIAGLGTWWLVGRAQRRLGIFTAAVSAAATVLGLIFAAAMRADDIAPTATFGVRFATTDQLQHNISLTLDGLAYLGGGHVFGERVGLGSLLGVVVGGAVIGGFGAGLWFTIARVRSSVRRRGRPDLGRPDQLAFLLFWGAALVLSLVSFLGSDLPQSAATGRYLIPAFYGVAVLLPTLAVGSARGRAYVAVGVLAFSVGVLARHIVEGPEEFGSGPTPAEIAAVDDFVAAQNAAVGYAGYQDAGVLTWETHGRLKVFPIYAGFGCRRETCRFPIMSVSSWYTERSRVRSFVVLHAPGTYTQLATLPQGAGRPIASAQFDRLAVYVYDHDVARDLEGAFGPQALAALQGATAQAPAGP